jgi:hypothetical protein
MTSPVLVYFSHSERFLTGLSQKKNAMCDELNVSCLDEVLPRQNEFKGGGINISI